MSTHAIAVEEYAAQVERFNAHMRSLGVDDIAGYYWYHTVDLPGGIATPGMYDYRATVNAFPFPEDMRGKAVLDVGSATGYFAFEFERRGADVVSVELPSLEMLDRFPGQETTALLSKIERMIVPHSTDTLSGLVHHYSAQELHHYLLEAPFRLCARLRGSKVQRHYSTIYDLSSETLGRAGFDFVFLGDILLHTLRPFDALVAAARMCSGTLVIAQMMPGAPDDPPAMLYQGGEVPGEDDVCWWLPNEQCFTQLLRKLGFAGVKTVGTYEGVQRPANEPFSRRILQATRAVSSTSS